MTAGRALAVLVTAPMGIEAELAADALWQAGAVAIEERRVPGGSPVPAGPDAIDTGLWAPNPLPGNDSRAQSPTAVVLVAAPADGGSPDALVAAVAGRWPVEVVSVDPDAALDAWRPFARAVTVGPVTIRPPWVPPATPAGRPDAPEPSDDGPAPTVTVGPVGTGGPPGAAGAPVVTGDTVAGAPGPVDAAGWAAAGSVGGVGSVGGAGLVVAGGSLRPDERRPSAGGSVGTGGQDVPRDASAGRAPSPAVEVVIDPGRAFGSGAHVSTRLALAALVAADPANAQRVVDVGCGSGVLAIAALLLGAGTGVGVDTDPESLAATRANAGRNALADRLAVVPSVHEAGDGDLVVANILAPVLVELAPAIDGLVRPGGAVVLAGFLAEQRDRVREAYGGLAPEREADEDGWVCLTLRKPAPTRSRVSRHVMAHP